MSSIVKKSAATTGPGDKQGPAMKVSVVMPCLDESCTVVACIGQAQAALEKGGYASEIIIADNGSKDGSQELARKAGAKVVDVKEKGYGNALLGGIAMARGKFVVMGDADSSYDFGDIPKLIEKLQEGYDVVIGNRFEGGIEPGAMPWHHRYIGNPILSGLGRILFRPGCRDLHCGLRAFDREKIDGLSLSCSGMEFASELVIKSSIAKLRITEIATRLVPDGREGKPHLRSFRDGYRHLQFMLASYLQSSLFGRISVGVAAILIVMIALPPLMRSSLWARATGEIIWVQQIGEVSVHRGEHLIQPIELKSLTSSPLKIIGAQFPCTCMKIEDIPLSVPAGSTEVLMLDVDTSEVQVGTHLLEIPLYLSQEGPPVVITLKVDIQEPWSR